MSEHTGYHRHRIKDNHKELLMSEKWKHINRQSNILGHLVAADDKNINHIDWDKLSERDCRVAATVVQWLGSPAGVGFLSECGFQEKILSECESQGIEQDNPPSENTLPQINDFAGLWSKKNDLEV